MAVSETVFGAQSKRLVEHYRPGEPLDRFGGWLEELEAAFRTRDWLSDGAMTQAVSDCIRLCERRGLPTVQEVGLYLVVASRDVARAASHALPAPRRDDNAATPEERERWAREDVQLRAYGARLRPTPPEVLARLSDEDRRDLIDYEERNQRVANWGYLTVPERRALDRRGALRRQENGAVVGHARMTTRPQEDER